WTGGALRPHAREERAGKHAGPASVDASEMTLVPALAGAAAATGRLAVSAVAAAVRGARSRQERVS
ncbi:MAG: hypothetical protein QMD96_09100, partial [Anaerosomatales bacterium]|nr:hypothetical protein [Anaerosomatales bacterium]